MKRIAFRPEWKIDEWHGFTRHSFEFEGCNAWIVEPHITAGDGRWSWVTQWADAFVKRTGAEALLEHGFYHVHIDVFKFKCSPEGVAIMGRFQKMLVSLGLSPKCNLIGMSWGGFFSLRYAETFPENVNSIYLDAPLCDAAEDTPVTRPRLLEIMRNFQLTRAELVTSLLNPINNVKAIVKIPVFALVGQTDQSVDVTTNFDVFAERFQAAGGELTVTRREYWGHHPHGLDDPTPLLEFHCRAREGM